MNKTVNLEEFTNLALLEAAFATKYRPTIRVTKKGDLYLFNRDGEALTLQREKRNSFLETVKSTFDYHYDVD